MLGARRIALGLAVFACLLSAATRASADSGENGAVPPPSPDPLAARRSAEKAAKIAATAAEVGSERVFQVLTGHPIAATLADDIGPDYAQLDMPVWQEPQSPYKPDVYPYNWCGPGATSGVASRWRVMQTGVDPVPTWPAQGPYPSGDDAYMYHLAYDLAGVSGLGDDDPWTDFTDFPQMISATNSAANAGGWYLMSDGLTFSYYQALLYDDLHETRVPLIPVVNTSGLPGWGTRQVMHWVTVRQYWLGGNTTTYGDAAGPIHGSSSTYGWHVVALDFFYGRIAAAYNAIVW